MTERETKLLKMIKDLEAALASKSDVQTPEIVAFVRKISQTQSKFAAEARDLLK